VTKTLFLYSTREGQTKKILEFMVERLPDHECDLIDIHTCVSVDLSSYDKVLIAASIRYGKFNKLLYQFIDRHHAALTKAHAMFVCINLTARKESEGKDTAEGSVYVKTFVTKSPWIPTYIAVFAGALRYPRYNLFDRYMIKLIMKLTGGETDTSKEVEYTNWGKVSKFAKYFAEN
jgi:menaquinone-dependent protoporphyrinogen oxidase